MKKSTVFAIIFCAVVLAAIVFFGVFFTVDKIDVRFENDVTSADKQAVLAVIDVDAQTNIFSVNEKKIKQKVEEAFKDNSIEVVKVVRSFPDKVTVVVRERTQLFKIRVKYEAEYVAADKDFRRNSIYLADQIEQKKLIEVNGFEVADSFAVDGCYRLKKFAYALLDAGFSEDALTTFVTKIDCEETQMVATLFDGATFTIAYDDVTSATTACIRAYYATPYAQRAGKAF